MGTTISTVETETREVRRNLNPTPIVSASTAGWLIRPGITHEPVAGGRKFTVTAEIPAKGYMVGAPNGAAAIGDPIASRVEVQNTSAQPITIQMIVATGIAPDGILITIPAGESRVAQASRVLDSPTFAVRVYAGTGGMPAAGVSFVILDGWTTEKAAVVPNGFTGSASPDPALIPSWTSTVNASESILSGVFPLLEVAPVAVEGYEATRETGTVIHDIIGAEFPDASLRPAGSRRGRMRLAFATEADAVDAFLALAYVGVFTCTNPTVPGIGMEAFVVAGEDLTIEADDSGAAWWVGMPFVEVAP